MKPYVDGTVASGFEEVRAEFERNFAERGEIGAAVAAYWRGEKVVDLWGGRRTPEEDEPWQQDTMVVVMSTTKGLAAMTLAVANARGWLDYDAPVARYWPEFAQKGRPASRCASCSRTKPAWCCSTRRCSRLAARSRLPGARAGAPETSVATGHSSWLPHAHHRAVHAGGHSSRGPQAPHAGSVFP